MIKRGHNEPRKSKVRKAQADTPARRENGGVGVGSRANRRQRCLQTREHCAGAVVALEAEVPSGRNSEFEGDQARPAPERRSSDFGVEVGGRAVVAGPSRNFDRIASDEKKESLGLDGPLYGRHLTKGQRESLLEFIEQARVSDSIETICGHLQMHPRSYHRWKCGMQSNHGGGGGLNKIRPLEEKRVVALVKKHPDWHCRRIAYHLEKTAKVFIGKTKVAEIMKAHGLNHPFERKPYRPVIEPADMLLHEPWQKNLLWGMDWTWINVDGRFMFLLVLLDWYSRKILSWGLHWQITKLQVVTLVTEAVMIEGLDHLPDGTMKPIVVADHGSANAAEYTRHNIEIQGLRLWLSGIGRPTGNARTERVIGTLKREEINLQEQYAKEEEAKVSIKNAIWDYNFNRPNQGNGGFAPSAVHHIGRYKLTMQRERARQRAEELRRKHWEQESSPSDTTLT
jgi:transposase InsO family protein